MDSRDYSVVPGKLANPTTGTERGVEDLAEEQAWGYSTKGQKLMIPHL